MITYILKFILCSGLLLLVYRAFLANEKLYKFNRFYLLFSLVFSLVVPFITIKIAVFKMPYLDSIVAQPVVSKPIKSPAPVQQYADANTFHGPVITSEVAIPEPVKQQALSTNNVGDTLNDQPSIQTAATNYLPGILLGIYGIISIILLVRFAKNGWHISHMVAKNAIVNYNDSKLVLINEDVTPHSFLKYIFINRDDYNRGAIEPEIICHEQTHVRQLHSVDIIIIELLQIVCWFNPFIPFYRKAIQLNHEFLADEAVIENYDNTPAYQYLLLAKASQASGLNLTSQFNYQITKKRLIMMTKNTSAKIALYKKLAILPLLAMAIFLFSQKSTAEILKVSAKTIDTNESKAVTVEYNDILEKYITKPAVKFTVEDRNRLIELFNKMTREEKSWQWFSFDFQVQFPMGIMPEDYKPWRDKDKYAIWLDGKRIANSQLPKQPYAVVRVDTTNNPKKTKDGLTPINLMSLNRYFHTVDKNKLNKVWYVDSYIHRVPDAADIEYAKYGFISTPPDPRDEEEAVLRLQKYPKYVRRNENHADKDAPAEIINAYNGILKKYDFNLVHRYGKGKLTDISAADTAQMHKLFKQMSERQQAMQYVRFVGALKPMPKNDVTAARLNAYSDDGKKYGVWIDGKRIKNSVLKNYKSEDFSQYWANNLTPILMKELGCRYQVHLLTNDAYDKEYNKVMADQDDRLVKLSARKAPRGFHIESLMPKGYDQMRGVPAALREQLLELQYNN